MAGGAVVNTGQGKVYPGRMTGFVFFTCLIGATGGLIFGYDIGISGGVTSMEVFLKKFFPEVYEKEAKTVTTNLYCRFDSPELQLFTSSLYLAALVASCFASTVTRIFGRKMSMLGGGITFIAGAALNGVAQNVIMLIVGRILLGIGVGFGNQAVPLYLSEMAPAKHRGMLNQGFQLMITVGILAANLVNFGTSKISGDYGWRVSLALAAVPGLIISVGSLFLPDTPNSLVERGHEEKAFTMLKKIRGTDDVQAEYDDLIAASNESKTVQHPWANIFKRKYRPQLTMAILLPFFQQITGINVVMFYAPVLFKTVGFGANASLFSSLITGFVNFMATFVSILTVDKVGRRFFFMQGGIQMVISQIIVGTLIAVNLGTSGEGQFSKAYASWLVVFICTFVSGFAWSWGPLAWLVASEIFPLEIRSAGQAINVSINMFMTFAIAQAFLTMLCHLKFGLFYFFAAWEVVMTIFIALFLPETKNIPIEESVLVWKKHWFWKRFLADEDVKVAGGEAREVA